jgi:hypothetical protein
MDMNRIERALRQGPPEPLYRGTSMNLLLAQADRRRGPTLASFTRLAAGLTAAIVLTAAGALLLMVLLRPSPAPLVGGPPDSGSPVPSATVAPTAVAPAPGTGSTPPDSTVSPPGSPTGTNTTQCDLVWTIGRVEGAAGSRFINVDVVNNGSATCILSALIGVRLTASDGSVIAEAAGGNSPAVLVEPDGRVTGFVQWTNWCHARPPTPPLTLAITEVDPAPQLSPVTPADPPPCNAPGKPSTVTPLQVSPAP